MDGTIVYINEAGARMHGFAREEAEGRNAVEVLLGSEGQQRLAQSNALIEKQGGFAGREMWNMRRDGTRFPVLANAVLVRDEAGNPDLVVATVQGNPRWAVEALERLGVPVYVTDVRGLRGLVRSLQRLARGLGCGGEAVERLRRSVEVPRPPPRRRVLLEVGGWPLVVAGPGSVQDELIRLAGGINVAAPIGRPYGRVCLEQALAWRPEVVLVSSMEGRARCRVALWRRLLPRARVVAVPSDLIDHPSPRALEALRLLRRWLR